jgi:chromosome segregation ATPase
MEAVQEGIDNLASLEERINRAVQVITNLRSENDDLRRRVGALEEELNTLRGERKQVKTRIEKLLSQLDLLTAS